MNFTFLIEKYNRNRHEPCFYRVRAYFGKKKGI
jgi:hypothetical protein